MFILSCYILAHRRSSRSRSKSYSSQSSSRSSSSFYSSYSRYSSPSLPESSKSKRRTPLHKKKRRASRSPARFSKRTRDNDGSEVRHSSDRRENRYKSKDARKSFIDGRSNIMCDRKKRSTNKCDEMKNSLACAEAIGLDKEYVRKMEEQKRLREELSQKKYKRMIECEKDANKTREINYRKNNEPSKATKKKSLDENIREVKLKPYLAVVINNIGKLSDAYRCMKTAANSIGPTKVSAKVCFKMFLCTISRIFSH